MSEADSGPIDKQPDSQKGTPATDASAAEKPATEPQVSTEAVGSPDERRSGEEAAAKSTEAENTASAPAASTAGSEASPPAASPATASSETTPKPIDASADASSAPADDDAEEVEPEVFEDLKPEVMEHAKNPGLSHHPPPPPSLRNKSVLQKKGVAQGDDPRFEVNGEPKLARDLMSRRLFTIGPEDTLEHLEEHMLAFRFRHLPVIEDDKVVGLITHRDLLHASSSFLSDRRKERDEIIHKVPAKSIMQHELITVRPTEPLADIAKLMWEAKIGCVLVTESNGKLVGIITEADFLRLAHHSLVRTQLH